MPKVSSRDWSDRKIKNEYQKELHRNIRGFQRGIRKAEFIKSYGEEALELVVNLKEKERDILNRFYGLDDREPETLESIAEIYQCSRQAIDNARNRALKKIKAQLATEILDKVVKKK